MATATHPLAAMAVPRDFAAAITILANTAIPFAAAFAAVTAALEATLGCDMGGLCRRHCTLCCLPGGFYRFSGCEIDGLDGSACCFYRAFCALLDAALVGAFGGIGKCVSAYLGCTRGGFLESLESFS